MSLAIVSHSAAAPFHVFAPLARTNACADCGARHGLCATVRAADLGRFATMRSTQSVAGGTTFADEGEAALNVFSVTSGTVRLFKLLPDGRRQIVGFLLPGDLFGFTPGESYTASAEAVDEVTLCRVPRRQLERALVEFPGMERQLLDLVARELAAAQDQMLLLGRKTAHERVASFLLGLDRRTGEKGWIDLPMTRTDIADYLGLTTETVSRVFTVLKGSGCIALAGSKVRIADPEALAELADGADER